MYNVTTLYYTGMALSHFSWRCHSRTILRSGCWEKRKSRSASPNSPPTSWQRSSHRGAAPSPTLSGRLSREIVETAVVESCLASLTTHTHTHTLDAALSAVERKMSAKRLELSQPKSMLPNEERLAKSFTSWWFRRHLSPNESRNTKP